MTPKTNSIIRLKPMSVNKLYQVAAIVVFVLIGIFSFSCQKKTNTNINYNRGIESAKNYVFAQQMMTQLLATYFKSIADSTLIADGYARIDGADVYDYRDQNPKYITMKYPEYSVVDGYGHHRGGIIDVTTETDFHETDAIINFKFSNFLYDFDTLVIDSLFMKNKGRVDGRNVQYETTTGDIRYYFSDSVGFLTFSLQEEFVLYKYESKFYTNPKDSLGIYGSMNGLTVNDLVFNTVNSSDSAVLFSYQCNYLKMGIVDVKTEDFKYETINYFQEADSCNNTFLITVDGDPFPSPIED